MKKIKEPPHFESDFDFYLCSVIITVFDSNISNFESNLVFKKKKTQTFIHLV